MTTPDCNQPEQVNTNNNNQTSIPSVNAQIIPQVPEVIEAVETVGNIYDGTTKPESDNQYQIPPGSGGNVNNQSTAKNGGAPNRPPSGNKSGNISPSATQTSPKKTQDSLGEKTVVDIGTPQLGKAHGKKIEAKKPCPNDPELLAKTIYPFNNVKESESGHVFEVDDTPGGERLHISHRTGSSVEVGPMGSVEAVCMRDSWVTVYRDAHVHIDGYTDVTLDKGFKIIINDDEIPNTKEKSVNFDIFVSGKSNVNLAVKGGNVNIRVLDGDVNLNMDDGDLNIRQNKGSYNHFVNGDYNLEVMGHMHTVVKGDVLTEVGGNRESHVQKNEEINVGSKMGCFVGTYQFGSKGDSIFYIAGDSKTTIIGNNNLHIAKNNLEQILQNNVITIGGLNNLFSSSVTNITSIGTIKISSSQLESCQIYAPAYLPGGDPPKLTPTIIPATPTTPTKTVLSSIIPTPSRKRNN